MTGVMKREFDGNDPKYFTCCCGAHITTLARVFIILDLISVVVTGSFIFLLPALIVGIGLYGVFKQSRAPLLIYVILGVVLSILSAGIVAALVVTDNFTMKLYTTENGKRQYQELPKEFGYIMAALCAVCIVIKLYFTYVYWKLSKFIKDRESQIESVRYVVA